MIFNILYNKLLVLKYDWKMIQKTLPFLFISSFIFSSVFLSFPVSSENTPLSAEEVGESFLRSILVETLQERQQAFSQKVLEKLQNDLEEKELLDESDPLYIDFRNAVDELNDFIDEQQKTLKAKEESINRKIRAFNRKADRYARLIPQYEELRGEVEALQFSQSSQVAELQSRLNTLGQELINIFNDFSEYSREAHEVSERLQAYVESVRNGNHPDAQAMRNIEDEANQVMENIAREIETEAEAVEALREEFNTWVKEKLGDVEELFSELNSKRENYNDEFRTYDEYIRYTNILIGEYNEIIDIEDSRGWLYSNERQQLNDLERDIANWEQAVEIQLNTVKRLDKEYEAFKKRVRQTEAETQSEIQEKKAYVEGEIQEHSVFASEQTNISEEIRAEALRQIEEISNNINHYIGEEEQRLKAIVGQMESEYGARYADFAGIGPLLESGNFDQLNSALFDLRASGGSKTEKAYNIAASMQMAQANLAAITGHLNSRNSLLQSMLDELSRLSSGMRVDEREIESLREELEEYRQESLQRIQEMEEGVHQKREAYEEGLESSLIEILDLHRSIIQNQVLIIAHVLLLEEDMDEFLHSWTEEKTRLNQEYNQEPHSAISGFFEEEDLSHQNITLSVTPYRFQDIQKSESLEGERKLNFVRGWYQLLGSRGVFSEEKIFLSDIFENSLEEVEDFFHALFVKSFSSSGVLVEEVKLSEPESTSESALPAYRLVLRAETFWLDEEGNLEQAPDRDPLFQHVFSVPWEQDTELGRQIREAYKSFKEQFKGKLEILGEKEKRAVVMAEALLRLAYQVRREAVEESSRFVSLAQSLFYLALNVSPAGDAIDLYECVTGYDIFGNELTGGERLLSGLSLFVGNRRLWTSFRDRFHNIFDPSASKHLKNYTRSTKWHRDLDKLLDYARSAEDKRRITQLIRAAKSLPEGVRVKRVLPGRSDKVAIIGRGMEDVPRLEGSLSQAARHLEGSGVTIEKFAQREKYRNTFNRLAKQTKDGKVDQILFKGEEIYEENIRWAEKIRDENYLVLDFGARGAKERSIFYDTEPFYYL